MTSEYATLHHLRTYIRKTLFKHLIFDAACITTVDPNSLLSTGSLTDAEIEPFHDQLLENEYLTEDLLSHVQLATSPSIKAYSLQQAVDSDLSVRLHTILMPAGFGDELRIALVSNNRCWGFISLFRRQSRSFFNKLELDQVTTLALDFAQTIEEIVSRQAKKHVVLESGLLVTSTDLNVIYVNTAGEQWLSNFRIWEGLNHSQLPRSIHSLRVQLQKENTLKANLVVSIPTGGYVQLRAEQLHKNDLSTAIAFYFEEASYKDIYIYIKSRYDLSDRESDVIEYIQKGLSTKQVADSLFISSYTVQDHLKSIFRKTGVHTRRELISLLHGYNQDH